MSIGDSQSLHSNGEDCIGDEKRIMRPDDIKQNGECVELMKLLTWECIVL